LLFNIFDQDKTPRPYLPSLLIDDDEPYLVVVRKMFQVPWLSSRNHSSRIGNFDASSKRVHIPSYGQGDDCGNYAADDAYGEIHSLLAYRHPGPRR
jgi:hypothetical protein